MKIAFSGDFSEKKSAYPIICHELVSAFYALGHDVLINKYNNGSQYADVLIACEYPPMVHSFPGKKICLTGWEFTGDYPVEKSAVLNTYDQVICWSEWCAEVISSFTSTPTTGLFLGLGKEFELGYDNPYSEEGILWVGGTDYRHGLDLVEKVADTSPLPIYVFQTTTYPRSLLSHPNVRAMQPVENLAPYYQHAKAFLLTARGVGFCMPFLEAANYGIPIVAPKLGPLFEFRYPNVFWVDTTAEKIQHHMYPNCYPTLQEPILEELLAQTEKAVQAGKCDYPHAYRWDFLAELILKYV